MAKWKYIKSTKKWANVCIKKNKRLCFYTSSGQIVPSLPRGLVISFHHRPDLPLPTLFLLSLPSSSSHHICFSSCSIPVFPKRILTCGFDELTHTLSLCSFSLFHYLILFSISQSLPYTTTTHMLFSFTDFSLSSPAECCMIMWSVCVVVWVYSCLFCSCTVCSSFSLINVFSPNIL